MPQARRVRTEGHGFHARLGHAPDSGHGILRSTAGSLLNAGQLAFRPLGGPPRPGRMRTAIAGSWPVDDPTNRPPLGSTSAAVPHQPGRAPETRQVLQLHDRALLHPRRPLALAAARPIDALLDMHPGRLAGLIVDGKDGHVGQSDEQRAHARRVGLHRGSGGAVGVGSPILRAPVPHAVDPSYTPTPRSDPKRRRPRDRRSGGRRRLSRPLASRQGSSSVIVPKPRPQKPPIVALVGADSPITIASSGSSTASPRTTTWATCRVVPRGNVSVPEAAT
jgi:hypothetical protein